MTAHKFVVAALAVLMAAACSAQDDAGGQGATAAQEGTGDISWDISQARKEVFYWDVDGIFALTDGGFVFIDQIPDGIQTLVGTPAQDLLLLGAFIEDEAGQVVGIASELEEFDRPVTEEARHDATWTLKISGRGTLVGHQIEISTPEARDFLAQLAAANEPWRGEFIAHGTVGPAANGMGIIMGGSGEFEGARGYMTEENVYREFDGTNYDVRTRLTFYLMD